MSPGGVALARSELDPEVARYGEIVQDLGPVIAAAFAKAKATGADVIVEIPRGSWKLIGMAFRHIETPRIVFRGSGRSSCLSEHPPQ
jgi:hypothetical protein